MKQKLINGDCIEELKKLPDNSVDSIVTDPPYGLGFMNKEWDSPEKHRKLVEREKQRSVERKKKGTSPTAAPFTTSVQPGLAIKGAKEGKWFQDWCELWATECLRVLKPGGHILSFGGTRTYHRMAVAIEDAGFEIRDCIFWCYGSGFPKSLNVGKSLESKLRNGSSRYSGKKMETEDEVGIPGSQWQEAADRTMKDDTPGWSGKTVKVENPLAKKWEGWGTALKPAVEPVVLGRKPLSEKTIVDNVLKHGTGGINIDDSRVSSGGDYSNRNSYEDRKTISSSFQSGGQMKSDPHSSGRFPANLILECICEDVIEGKEEVAKNIDFKAEKQSDMGWGTKKCITKPQKSNYNIHTNPDCPCYVLDEQSGITKGSGKPTITKAGIGAGLLGQYDGRKTMPTAKDIDVIRNIGDNGGASRFFKEIPKGRFPANLILECICDEVVEGKAKGSPGHWSKTETKGYGDFGGGSSSYEGVGVKDDMKTIIHTNPDCPCFVLDEQSGNRKGWADQKHNSFNPYGGNALNQSNTERDGLHKGYNDNGGASRYFKEIEGDRIFYTAKASKSERNNGLEGFEEAPIKGRDAGQDIRSVPYKQRTTPIKNPHPTVKPVKLMRYLIKLITPPNGTVLDPFMGSGTTGVAAKLEGFNFVGIEKEKEYIKIAEARIKNYKENPKKKTKPKKKKVKKVKSKFWK